MPPEDDQNIDNPEDQVFTGEIASGVNENGDQFDHSLSSVGELLVEITGQSPPPMGHGRAMALVRFFAENGGFENNPAHHRFLETDYVYNNVYEEYLQRQRAEDPQLESIRLDIDNATERRRLLIQVFHDNNGSPLPPTNHRYQYQSDPVYHAAYLQYREEALGIPREAREAEERRMNEMTESLTNIDQETQDAIDTVVGMVDANGNPIPIREDTSVEPMDTQNLPTIVEDFTRLTREVNQTVADLAEQNSPVLDDIVAYDAFANPHMGTDSQPEHVNVSVTNRNGQEDHYVGVLDHQSHSIEFTGAQNNNPEEQEAKEPKPEKPFLTKVSISTGHAQSDMYRTEIRLEILSQPDHFTAPKDAKDPILLFTASNGWKVLSHVAPEIIVSVKEIYVRGHIKVDDSGWGGGQFIATTIIDSPDQYPPALREFQQAMAEFTRFAEGKPTQPIKRNITRIEALEMDPDET